MGRLKDILNLPTEIKGKAGVTLDWSSFDSTIPVWLIHEAFDVIWSTYTFPSESIRKKFEPVFKYIKNYFIHTPIMLSDGVVWQKSHGIPSGSSFTQLVGSIVNILVTRTLLAS